MDKRILRSIRTYFPKYNDCKKASRSALLIGKGIGVHHYSHPMVHPKSIFHEITGKRVGADVHEILMRMYKNYTLYNKNFLEKSPRFMRIQLPGEVTSKSEINTIF
jgi:hypothetical protein